ncbi:hypothetical protein MKW98_016380 [Papaver atlanticum]|uniref:Uncharacterized protein n=1 Tax=Papaver atlanticum TaxID=357466 RepID=A0AAD4RWF5_9MAGN|nr:hypothetical protein MKW98_016380 [Papaver atlanticum]
MLCCNCGFLGSIQISGTIIVDRTYWKILPVMKKDVDGSKQSVKGQATTISSHAPVNE